MKYFDIFVFSLTLLKIGFSQDLDLSVIANNTAIQKLINSTLNTVKNNIISELAKNPQILLDPSLSPIYLDIVKLTTTGVTKDNLSILYNDLKKLLVQLQNRSDYKEFTDLISNIRDLMRTNKLICGPYLLLSNPNVQSTIKNNFEAETKNLRDYLNKTVDETEVGYKSLIEGLNNITESNFTGNYQNQIDRLEGELSKLKERVGTNSSVIIERNIDLYLRRMKYRCENKSSLNESENPDYYYKFNETVFENLTQESNSETEPENRLPNSEIEQTYNSSNTTNGTTQEFINTFKVPQCSASECAGCCVDNVCMEDNQSCKNEILYHVILIVLLFLVVLIAILIIKKRNPYTQMTNSRIEMGSKDGYISPASQSRF